MAKTKRLYEVAKELGVASKAIVEKCQAEGVPGIENHMSQVKLGLVETIREWFRGSAAHNAIETAERVDLDKARKGVRRRKARAGGEDEQDGVDSTATLTDDDTSLDHEHHALAECPRLSLADLDEQPMILYPQQALPGLAQRVAGAFQRDGLHLRLAQEVEDVLTAVALVSSGFGLCITTESSMSLRLPGVAFRPLDCEALRDIELACLYRREPASPVLAAFLEVVHDFARQRPTHQPQ